MFIVILLLDLDGLVPTKDASVVAGIFFVLGLSFVVLYGAACSLTSLAGGALGSLGLRVYLRLGLTGLLLGFSLLSAVIKKEGSASLSSGLLSVAGQALWGSFNHRHGFLACWIDSRHAQRSAIPPNYCDSRHRTCGIRHRA